MHESVALSREVENYWTFYTDSRWSGPRARCETVSSILFATLINVSAANGRGVTLSYYSNISEAQSLALKGLQRAILFLLEVQISLPLSSLDVLAC